MIVLYIILGLIVLFLVVAAFVGRGWSFEKNILIQASRSNVWGHVNSLGAMNIWNPWLDMDPLVSQSISGIDADYGGLVCHSISKRNRQTESSRDRESESGTDRPVFSTSPIDL